MLQSNNSQIKSGAIISYMGIIISTIASLLYTPWMKIRLAMQIMAYTHLLDRSWPFL